MSTPLSAYPQGGLWTGTIFSSECLVLVIGRTSGLFQSSIIIAWTDDSVIRLLDTDMLLQLICCAVTCNVWDTAVPGPVSTARSQSRPVKARCLDADAVRTTTSALELFPGSMVKVVHGELQLAGVPVQLKVVSDSMLCVSGNGIVKHKCIPHQAIQAERRCS